MNDNMGVGQEDNAQPGNHVGSPGHRSSGLLNIFLYVFQSLCAKLGESLAVRAGILGALLLLLMMPLGVLNELVYERQSRHQMVIEEISNNWGLAQTLQGPFIAVPYVEKVVAQEQVVDKSGNVQRIDKTKFYDRTAFFLPENLTIDFALVEHTRKRGIYESLLYQADVSVAAKFNAFSTPEFSNQIIQRIDWTKARLVIGLTDARAISNVGGFTWNNEPLTFKPGTGVDFMRSGFQAAIDLSRRDKTAMVIGKLAIKGSDAFSFMPLGNHTKVNAESKWPHPSFDGNAMPSTRDISQSGFKATWEISSLARNYPQVFNSESKVNVGELVGGVALFETVSLYTQVNRAVKYGLLFISLTFLTLFLCEFSWSERLHIIQYALVGSSLCVFFLLLLSMSEHIGFIKSYVVAAIVTVGVNALYVGAALRRLSAALIVMFGLGSLYGVLFTLLRMEDHALLAGSALVLFVMVCLMYATRNSTLVRT